MDRVAASSHTPSTRVPSELGNEKPFKTLETPSEKDEGEYSGLGYLNRGVQEIEDEDGKKKKVKVVLEQKTGRELIRESHGGPYTQPRW